GSPIPQRDVAKARALLKEAGVANASVTLMTPTTSDAQRVAQVVQAMAKEAGFDIKIQSTEFASSLALADKGQYEAYVLAWSGRADPDGNFQQFYTCNAPNNYSGYCSPDMDKLIQDSRTALDPARRKQVYEQIAAIVSRERPIIYLYHRHWLWAYTARLAGLRPVPDGLVRVQGLRMN
ncbi:MAG TPA: ABC transporter substrate-binding protein, partial [Alphaproteobacteria bacterium]|nr:ABC transporter substrate-binding protein [Alphaproteobacteria bacterium]